MAFLSSTYVLKDVITADLLGGVMKEIVGLLPVVVPTVIGFIGIRKGLSFLMGMIRQA